MPSYILCAIAAMNCFTATAFGTEYVLDITRLQVDYGSNYREVDDPESLITKSIEINIEDGVDFHTRLRSKNEVITVKGRLSKCEKIPHHLEISVDFSADEERRAANTSIAVVPEEARIFVSMTSWGGKTDKLTQDLICVCLDMRPSNDEVDARRREALKRQHTELVRKAKAAFESEIPETGLVVGRDRPLTMTGRAHPPTQLTRPELCKPHGNHQTRH